MASPHACSVLQLEEQIVQLTGEVREKRAAVEGAEKKRLELESREADLTAKLAEVNSSVRHCPSYAGIGLTCVCSAPVVGDQGESARDGTVRKDAQCDCVDADDARRRPRSRHGSLPSEAGSVQRRPLGCHGCQVRFSYYSFVWWTFDFCFCRNILPTMFFSRFSFRFPLFGEF